MLRLTIGFPQASFRSVDTLVETYRTKNVFIYSFGKRGLLLFYGDHLE